MTKLYTYDVSLTTAPHLIIGEPITVNGTPMVRMAHGTIVRADGWFSTDAEARADAADRLQNMVRQVLGRIHQLRTEATA